MIPNLKSALAISSSPCVTASIDPAANRLENPANLPTAVITVPTSAKEPPIPTSPCLIASQDIMPNLKSALAISSSPCVTASIDPAANRLENPAIFPIAESTVANSAKEPPIPTRPLFILSESI